MRINILPQSQRDITAEIMEPSGTLRIMPSDYYATTTQYERSSSRALDTQTTIRAGISMRISKFDPKLKERAFRAIEGDTPVKDIAAELEIPEQTVRNWKSELNRKKNGGNGTKKKKSKPTVSVEQQLEDTEFTVSLHALEIETLRSMLNVTERVERLLLYNAYLCKRLGLFGDTLVKPFEDFATE